MGMFDRVHCDLPLPDPKHQDLEFQTKDLDCLLDRYTISAEGRLVRQARRRRRTGKELTLAMTDLRNRSLLDIARKVVVSPSCSQQYCSKFGAGWGP